MKLQHIAFALLIAGSLGAAVPAVAQAADSTTTLATPVPSGNAGNNASNMGNTGAANSSNGTVGDTPNATATGPKCFRRDKAGDIQIVCPDKMQDMQ